MDIHVNPHVTPVVQPYRRVPIHLEDKLEKQLDSLEQRGIIEHVNEPARWVSAIVPVVKANGEVRPCLNMRPANKAIVRENHPLPTCEEMWPQLQGSTVFSKLDIKDAFHQIELAESSRFITTFITKRGLMRYTRLMFGINNAPELFQKTMDKILAGCKGVLVYLDDILVHGKDKTEHDIHLQAVLERLKQFDVMLNKEKLEIGKSSVKFVGHVISADGIRPAIDKLEAIRKCRKPESPEEIRSFLGLVTYLGSFIPDLATKAAPLRRLIVEGKDSFAWEVAHDKCFQEIKDCITNDLKLSFFDRQRKTTIVVDASPVGLGAILTQKDEKGKDHVVMFASKTLADPEKRYCQTEKEALAIVWAIERFHHFVAGSSFYVVTDHKALIYIFHSSSKPCARIERWVLRLQPYEFTVVFGKGKDNLADPLSRLSAVDEMPETFDEDASHYVNEIIEATKVKAVSLAEIKEGCKLDHEFGTLEKALLQGTWTKEVEKWKSYAGEFSHIDGLILRSNRIYIPTNCRQRILTAAHEGHPGKDKLMKRLREKVWWPTMTIDAEEKSKSCFECALVSAPNPPVPMKTRELPDGPWRDLAADFTSASSFGKELLVIVDYYSRYVDIKIQSGLTAGETNKSFLQTFSVFGFPRSITCDNGQPFSSAEFIEMCDTYGIKIFHAPPRWPQANGLVERQNVGIKKRLQISKASGSKSWQDDLLIDYLVMYRSTPQDTTGKSPFELMFNRKMKDKIPLLLQPQEGDLDQEVRAKDKAAKERMKATADKKRGAKESNITEGDKVLLRNLPGNKLTTNFGPEVYTVIKASENGDYVIKSDESGVERRRNITALKRVPTIMPVTPTTVEDNRPPSPFLSSYHSQPTLQPLDASEDLPRTSKRARKAPDYLMDYVSRAINEEKGEM